MKIDFAITELEVGGAEKCMVSLVLHAHQQGHQVRVIVLDGRPDPSQELLALQLEKASVPVHYLGGRHPLQLPKILMRWRKWVKESPPDIAQSFLFHANVASAWIYPPFQIPLVGGNRVAEPRRWRYSFGRWAASRMKKLVCVSEGVRKWTMRHEGVPEEKLITIPNGVALRERAGPSKEELCRNLPIGPSEGIFLFVGRLEHQKGVDALLQKGDTLLRQLPNWHWVLIGDGPQRGQLEQMRNKLEVKDRIHLLGWKSNPRDWMAISNLLLLPARYEGMPNVVLEAMAEGMAVLSTRVEGIEEAIGTQVDLQTTPVGDMDRFLQQAITLASNSELLIRLGSENRAFASTHHAMEQRLNQYLELYRHLQS